MLGDSLVRFDRVPGEVVVTRPCLVVRGLSGQRARNLTFSVDAGEVVGITGAPGSGFDEVPALLAGDARATEGSLQLAGADVDLARYSVPRAMRAGVMLVPERRDRDGLALELTVQDNVTLPALKRLRRPLFLSKRWRTAEGRRAVQEHGIRPANPHALVRQLSGGNQQKVLLAKWMRMSPKLLILHEPTQAVDVGARSDILHRIAETARSGAAVVVVSSEADDLTAICDRVLIHRVEGGLALSQSRDADELLEQVFTGGPSRREQ